MLLNFLRGIFWRASVSFILRSSGLFRAYSHIKGGAVVQLFAWRGTIILLCEESLLRTSGLFPLSERVNQFLRTSHGEGTYWSFSARLRWRGNVEKGIGKRKGYYSRHGSRQMTFPFSRQFSDVLRSMNGSFYWEWSALLATPRFYCSKRKVGLEKCIG